MAESLSGVPLLRSAVLCAALLAAAQAMAQDLADPTRPPSMNAAQPGGGEPVSSDPMLQSVLISPTRREAIIGGQVVTVGTRVGDAQVVQILEYSVVLRNKKGLQTLKLFPGIEISVTTSRNGYTTTAQRNFQFEKKQ